MESLRRYRLRYMMILEQFLAWECAKKLSLRLHECSLPILRWLAESYVLTPKSGSGTDTIWDMSYDPACARRSMYPALRLFFAKDLAKTARHQQALVDGHEQSEV